MKKTMNFSLALAVVLTAATSYATHAKDNALYTFERENPVSEIYKPFVRQQNSLVSVSIVNAGSSAVAVKILETDGTLIYSGTFESKNNFFKKFDISEFPKGDYVFEFSYSNNTFTETVSKR